MFVGMARLELHIPAAQSLKDKRRVLRSLRDHAEGKAAMSVAEVDANDLWQRGVIGLAKVYRDAAGEEDFRRTLEQLANGEDYIVSGRTVKFEKFA